jgi:Holliday junction DNA helicase RuvB
LNHFIGQGRVIGYLAGHIEAARRLAKPLPPFLFLSPPGMGKTTLAEALSTELGVGLFTLVANPKTTREQLVGTLASVNHADILLIDEGHRLPDPVQELLFRAIDDCKIPARAEDGRLDETRLESISEFSPVVATTDPDRLLPPFRSRLIEVQFDRYTPEDLKAIAERVAGLHQYRISPQAARALANIPGVSTPRQIELYIDEMASFADPGETELGKALLLRLLRHKGINHRGLGPYHRGYLQILADSPQESCSVTCLASRLGLPDRTVRHLVEPLLLELKLVEITTHLWRVLTPAGRLAAAEAVPDGGPGNHLVHD